MTTEPSPETDASDAPSGGPLAREGRLAERQQRRRARRERNRGRILKTTAVLPSLFTLSNGLLGFAAIYLATRRGIDAEPALLGVAAWLLAGAMICDMLDGRLARFTRRTSDFGGQLDSMCDVISFGVAPPVLMLRTVLGAVRGPVGKVAYLARLTDVGLERVLWCAAAVYVAGAALRLARFNVENEPDESAHMSFRGLPSPGAAAAVATLVLLYDHLLHINDGGWLFGPWLLSMDERLALWLCAAISVILPVMTLAGGLLMVSRFRYSHVVNHYIRGKRPFSYLVKMMVIVLVAVVVEPFVAAAAAAMVYALSAPLTAAWLRLRRSSRPLPAAPASHGKSTPDRPEP
ncbi:MAG TPA: CDP-alcohol phosphatidyltransferase family protein [Phycisphaerae bacterium]|nr:CDP-alcohol phosphatidyltransferase family protein [Phycisphaerae bacterium]